MPDRLRRRAPRVTVRIVHLGLGAFHRAHQAWYTAHSDPGQEWGIAAFTGRSPDAARILRRQDCLYTLVTREPDGDRVETVESIVAAHDGADTDALRDYLRRPEVTVVTLTVTEKGYRQDERGNLDTNDPEVAADLQALSVALTSDGVLTSGILHTMPGRLLWALDARRRALPDATITLIPCDNLPDNGAVLRRVLHDLAGATSPPLAAWISAQVDIVSTSVDRITPRTTTADIDAVAMSTGIRDEALVVTEPFHSWILAGRIRAPRPPWEAAGAVVVTDIEPFEQRKLWMLNGAHSLLAYEGILRGHETVAAAIRDPECLARVHALWDLDESLLASADAHLDLAGYRDALIWRFSNPAIAHRLRQIATDGSIKLRARILDPLRRARGTGAHGEAALAVLEAWARFVGAEERAGHAVDADSAELIATLQRDGCLDPSLVFAAAPTRSS